MVGVRHEAMPQTKKKINSFFGYIVSFVKKLKRFLIAIFVVAALFLVA